MNKKGAIQELQALIAPLVGVAIVLVVGFLIFAEVKTQVIDGDRGSFCPTGFTYSNTSICCNSTGGVGHCSGVNTTTAGYSYAYNGTETVQNAMQDIPGWLPIIIITVIGAILLGLVAYFRRR